jgi:hypothetical protein
MNIAVGRPEPTEYVPYFDRYISLVSSGDILVQLERQMETTLPFLGTISEAASRFRYAPDKWSIREVVGHVIDTERIMAYRALRFARADQTPVEGFEQDDYVKHASFDDCPLLDLARELQSVRKANLHFFRSLNDAAWLRRGLASKNEVSVRALAYIIAGHELHHLEVLRTLYAK